MDIQEEALLLHEKKHGKIAITSKVSIQNNKELALAYTPGVAEPCKAIAQKRSEVYRYTAKGNLVAVISDGSAVLGLGNIGAEAAMPVMEGKAVLFKQFGGIDAMPICLGTQIPAEIIQSVKMIAPTFGGINLEDIASPQCFEIEKKLDELLDIPVFHDDQHGTAIVVAAAIINSLKLIHKNISDVKIIVNGPGSAGTAIITMLLKMGAKKVLVCDEHGLLSSNRSEKLMEHKQKLAERTNPENEVGTLSEALVDADIFVGVSIAGILTPDLISKMKVDPIVFALANPEPEIMYDLAKSAGVRIMGTGRSDFPNQINNVLAFPGIFKGALSVRATTINDEMKFAAAKAISDLIKPEELREDYIIPKIFDARVAEQVASYVAEAARRTGVNQI